jgi:hypothetical protein
MEAGCGRACGVEEDFLFQKVGKGKQETPLVRSDIRILPFWKFMIKRPRPKG